MSIIFSCIGALLLIGIGVLQFTKIWDQPCGKTEVSVLAVLAGLCLAVSSIFQYVEKRRAAREQAERERQLPGLIAEAIARHSSTETNIPIPAVADTVKDADVFTLSPRKQLETAQEAVFVEEVLARPVEDLKVNLAHDRDFRQKYDAVPMGKYQKLDALRKILAKEPIIAAKYLRAHLMPRSPYAEMVKDVFTAAGREDYETTSDFLFEVHAVNITDNTTTIQKIMAEAEIGGKWVVLPQLVDLSNYELAFYDSNEEANLPLRDPSKIEALPSFWNKVNGVPLHRGVGYTGWLGFELTAQSSAFAKPVNHKVRLVDALGGIHPIVTLERAENPDGRIRHSSKVYER